MNPTNNNFLRGLRENWVLIAFIGGLLITWTTLKNKVDTVQASQNDQRTELTTISKDVADLKGAVIESKANFIFIKESLTELKADIRSSK